MLSSVAFYCRMLAPLVARQLAFPILRAQNVATHRHRRAESLRVLAVIVIRAFGQRMHQDVEAVAVEHQPRNDILELRGLENHVELRNWVRTDGFVAERTRLGFELGEQRLTQLRRLRLADAIVIDVGVKPADFAHYLLLLTGITSHASSCAAIFLLISARHSSMDLNPGWARQ